MTAPLPTLEKLDPVAAWKPWRPSADEPWNRKWAAHLYRRAAFGANRDELIDAEKLGVEGTLDLLLRGKPDAGELLPTLLDTGRRVAASKDGDGLRGWWVYWMLQGGHPLREKLTLFWHNHFATSIAKVRDTGAMFNQNRLLREHALGKFGPMLQAISQDEAMLIWLDSNSNVKGAPNENYAREVMELFSLGVGNYTERDVREAARAFTGWHTDTRGFRFHPKLHDDGPKTVLGRTGNWDGTDVVKIILEQPAAARFLVRKLYTAYVSEIAPPDSLLEPLCEAFRKGDYDVAALLKTVLSSRHFFSDHAYRKRIKGPVEFVLGATRAIYHAYDEKHTDHRPLPQKILVQPLTAMGQALFAPPNVKGWPGSRVWLNTATLLERTNFAAALASGSLFVGELFQSTGFQPVTDVPPPRAFDSARLLDEEKATQPEAVARALCDLHLGGDVRLETIEKLTRFIADGKPTGVALARRTREATHAVLAMPEYHLC